MADPIILKCAECERVGAAYRLSWGGVYARTAMAFYPFVDDQGKRHYHDNNWGGTEFWECSNGHCVAPERLPSCWCGWPVSGAWAEEDRERIAGYEARRAAKAALTEK